MYYLRNYDLVILSDGQYKTIKVELTKSDAYGIMKRNYVHSVPSYDGSYVTEYSDTKAIKHPTEDMYCVEFKSLIGINPIYLNYLETKEQLELDGWIIDSEANGIEIIPISEVPIEPSLKERIDAIENIIMDLLI